MVELTTASVTIFAVFKLKRNSLIFFSFFRKELPARTLVLNLRLGEGFQGGRNDFPQSSFLTLDGYRGHGLGCVAWSVVGIGKPTKNLSFPSLMSEN
jgi:hypothetical protein